MDDATNHGNIAAIVLAAGLSQRMGRLKPLLPFDGKPMLARVLDNLLAAAPIASIIVVTGHAAPEIRHALDGYPVEFAHNAGYATGGMVSSVQTGVRALPEGTAAFLLVLGDQPVVQSATLQALLAAWRETDAPIVLPVHSGRRGHPVVFARRCAGEILDLPADATLRSVVARHAALEVVVDDAAVLDDVDTPEDYERALQCWRNRS
ncbi:MAG: nucleotidyltransferase family protein [Armatimonadota bacterium]|nr:nucleotidyltransferase family protein [Armatimonadota bacterium]